MAEVEDESKVESQDMLAPVVTKDMHLFGLARTNKNNLRNVRARAQSLNEVATGTITRQQLQATRSVSAGGHRVPKSSMSVGNLPLAAGSAGSSGPSSTSSSPPKNFTMRKAPLDPIVEGVELGAVTASVPAIVVKKRSGAAPTAEQSLLNQLPPATNLQKHPTALSLVDTDAKKKKEGGVFGWFSKAFSSKKKNAEDQPGTSRDTAEAASSSSGEADASSPSKKKPAPKKRH